MNVQIKDSDRWLEAVLFSLRKEGPIGDSERRHWHDPLYAEVYKGIWKSAPKWFKEAARPYLDKRYQPKPKPRNLADIQIMDALEFYAPKTEGERVEKE